MDFKNAYFSDYLIFRLNILVFSVSISLALVLTGACTKEEETETQIPLVAYPIKKPIPQRPEVSPAGEKTDRGQKKMDTAVKEEKAETEPAEKVKAEPAKKLPLAPETEILVGKGPEAHIPEAIPEKGAPAETESHYRVKKGDTLFKVAGLKEVYNNPLKWTSLFRLNMDLLKGMEASEDFFLKELPTGIDLRFTTRQEAARKLKNFDRNIWVINILSSKSQHKIMSVALTLMKEGYTVYITEATVKGKKWLRLRTGFYDTYPEATAAGKEIMPLLQISGSWVTKIEKEEFLEYAG